MHINYPELVAPSAIGLFCVVYVLPWHVRVRNLATLSMAFWMGALNLVHLINSLLWNEGVENKAAVWCDITIRSARRSTEENQAGRRLVFGDLHPGCRHLVAFDPTGKPAFDDVPATYWNAWGVLAMSVFPVAIGRWHVIDVTFRSVMALANIYLRRKRMLDIVSADSAMGRNEFLRLYIVSVAEIATCTLRAIFNMIAYISGPSPLSKNMPSKPISLKTIGYVTKNEITDLMWKVLVLQWYTVTACSVIFFLCFATGSETVKFYHRFARTIFPCIASRKPDSDSSIHTASTSGIASKPSHSTLSSSKKLIKPEDGDAIQLGYVLSLYGNAVGPPQHSADNETSTPGSPRSPGLASDQAEHTVLPTPIDRPATARISIPLRHGDKELDLEAGQKRVVKVNSTMRMVNRDSARWEFSDALGTVDEGSVEEATKERVV
ncbi:hypothetical protein QFC20_002749 [Naganishia adeliensis]|uniref:Uncharacterized protein n=1 Tax=Naganishia adeliensis TaxID=92952 RepID=A0ACC2WIT2_9TREE|nr:hypothetical protein QFC20_002749 [Naganishia adeliensis]